MAERGKTVIHIEIIHGKGIRPNLDAKGRKDLSNGIFFDYLGEIDLGEDPTYTISIDGETRVYNEANEYNPDPEN